MKTNSNIIILTLCLLIRNLVINWDEMDNNLPDGLSCTVHQGPAELYQEGFTELGRLTDRCQTERCPWSSRLGVRLRADNPIPEKLHLLQKHWQHLSLCRDLLWIEKFFSLIYETQVDNEKCWGMPWHCGFFIFYYDLFLIHLIFCYRFTFQKCFIIF